VPVVDPTTMVTHCICYGRSFLELKLIAEKHGVKSIEQLQDHIDFGLNCKLCHPYVKKMLETGQTKFEVITGE
jgi:bacterioferritin-associated ferredoxin